jgi:mono/diheme cytochrome c family protein
LLEGGIARDRVESGFKIFGGFMRAVAVVVVLAVAIAGVFLFVRKHQASVVLQWSDPAIVAEGKALYHANCASCHGNEGQGQPGWDSESSESKPLAPPHDGSGHTWEHPSSALFELIKSGSSAITSRSFDSNVMPNFENSLYDGQIIKILSYIKSIWPEDIRQRHDQIDSIFGG